MAENVVHEFDRDEIAPPVAYRQFRWPARTVEHCREAFEPTGVGHGIVDAFQDAPVIEQDIAFRAQLS